MASVSNKLNLDDMQKKQEQQDPAQPTLTSSSPAFAGMGGQARPGQQNQQRFTNVQQYLQANKKGIQNVAGRLQGGIGRQLGQQEEGIKKETGDIQDLNTNQIQQNIKKAQGFQQQLGSGDFNAETFTGAPTGQSAAPQSAAPQSAAPTLNSAILPFTSSVNTQVQSGNEDISAERLAADQARTGGQVQTDNVAQPPPAPSVPPQQSTTGMGQPPEAFKQFVGLRTGTEQAKTQQQLSREAQESSQAINKANEIATGRLGQLGSEQGRSGLLSEFVGGRKGTYGSSGLSKLDQALLQKDPNRSIQNLQKTTKTKRDVDFANLAKVDESTVGSAKEAQQQSADLGQGLQKTADTLEQSNITNLEAQVPGFNQKRTEEKAALTKTFDILTGKQTGKITQQELDQLNLSLGLQSFNVLNDKDFNKNAYAKFSEQMASGYKDVATQRDVEKYKALANLSKSTINPDGQLTGAREDQLKLNKAGDMEAATQVLRDGQGKSLLRGRIDDAGKNFMDEAMRTVLTGEGKESYSGGWGSSGGESTMNQSANMGEVLRNAGYEPTRSGGSRATGLALDSIAGAYGNATTSGQLDPSNVMGDLVDNSNQNLLTAVPKTVLQNPLMFLGGGGLMAGGQLSNVVSSIANTLGGGGGAAGAEGAAAAKARADLETKVNAYLRQKGFGNVVTMGGAKDTSDITDQQRGVAQEEARRLKQNQQQLDTLMGTSNQFSMGGNSRDSLQAAISGEYDAGHDPFTYAKKDGRIGKAASPELAAQAQAALASNDINQLTNYAKELQSKIPMAQTQKFNWMNQRYENVMAPDGSSPEARIASAALQKAGLLGAEGQAGIKGGAQTQQDALKARLERLYRGDT